ncbi:MAG: TolC family protein [Lentisphaerae bacterium]|nr:TolC family protein [Lentisphaerota bacterium]
MHNRAAALFGVLAACAILLAAAPAPAASSNRVLRLDAYIALATSRDTEFEAILIDELTLQYRKALRLPARDLVLSVKQEYVSLSDGGRNEGATAVSLGKLFPYTGTDVAATYAVEPAADADRGSPGSVSFSLAQPVARNAFGRATRLLDRIVGVETNVARHQIVEAYEDYLASVIVAYYEWWEAYENLEIGRSSYRENMRLLDNMLERQQQQVALPVDVNKTRIQLLAKKENLVELTDAYSNRLQVIERIVRHDGRCGLRPEAGPPFPVPEAAFDEVYAQVRVGSRTFRILDLLERRSALDVDREADDLLPSMNLLFAAELAGEDYALEDLERTVSVGLALEWPLPGEADRAEQELAELALAQARLATENTHYRLYTRLKNLYLQIRRERALTAIADEKLDLARSVLEDERENYSFGKVSLNDYIAAVNVLDNNRFSRVRRDAAEKILTIEWLRLADRLISRRDLPEPPGTGR